jgi:hypothetical protein
MFSKSRLTLVLALAAALAPQTIPHPQAGAPPAIPDTPAGRTFLGLPAFKVLPATCEN